jgi:hypothetical protein
VVQVEHIDVDTTALTREVPDKGTPTHEAQDKEVLTAHTNVGTNALTREEPDEGELVAPGEHDEGVPVTTGLTISGSSDPIPVPNTWHEYEGLPEHHKALFRAALDKEWTSILDHGTFRPTRIQEAKALTPRIMSTRWLFKVKADRSCKARCVVRGFEEPNLTKEGVYSPTPTPVVVRLIVLIAMTNNWALTNVDFSTAFLNSEVSEDEHLYVYPPEGVINPGVVYQLLGGLYGLASSPLRWYLKLVGLLLGYGLTQHQTEPCMFYTNDLALCLWVDDLKIAGPGTAAFIAYLQSHHKCTEQPNSEYLSMAFLTSADGKTTDVQQQRYIQDMLASLNCINAVPTLSPFSPTTVLTPSSNPLNKQLANFYRTAVGKLGYLTMTRPELSFAFSELSRHNLAPGAEHLGAVQHLLRYLQGTAHLGYTVRASTMPLILTAYSDSNFASEPSDRKSVSGRIVFAGSTPVLWGCSRQTILATSSTMAELIALELAATDLMDLRALLSGMGCLAPGPSTLFSDSQSAMALTMRGPLTYSRGLAKHVAVKLYKLREYIDGGDVVLAYVRTAANPADIFTKSLPVPILRHHLDNIRAGTVFGLPNL